MHDNPYFKFILPVLVAILIGVGAYKVGFEVGREEPIYIDRADASGTPLGADFSLFWETLMDLKESYAGSEGINDEKLTYGAIDGLVKAVGDPYTQFFAPVEAQSFQQDIDGRFGGIGAEIGVRNGSLVIIAPLKNNPAEVAGLKAGDVILRVDETVVTGDMSIDEAINLIRGKPGDRVTLLVYREGFDEPKEFVITRDTIELPTLDLEFLDNDLAYLRIYSFNANLPVLFRNAAELIRARGARGIVLDVRNNPGGYLDVVNDVSGWFLVKGSVIMEERHGDDAKELLKTSGNGRLSDIPVVVLVNNGSASASEIIAGALRDLRGAKLVGEKTFGKGSVQEVRNLSGGATLKVTVAEWFTPNGTVINKNGLVPDVSVSSTVSHDEGSGFYGGSVVSENDEQLNKAIQILKEEITAR